MAPGRTANPAAAPLPPAEFAHWYGPWEPLDPGSVTEFMAGFDRPWWIVGGCVTRSSGPRPRSTRGSTCSEPRPGPHHTRVRARVLPRSASGPTG